jgi:hypothetical protein
VKHHLKSSYINSQDRTVELFTSVTFLVEFLSTDGIDPTARFKPTNFYRIRFLSFFLWNEFYLIFSSKLQLICINIYLIFIIYFMCNGIHSLFKLKFNYFRQFWPYIEFGIVISSWANVGIYIWPYQEYQRISSISIYTLPLISMIFSY